MRTLTVEGPKTHDELLQLYKQEKHKIRKRRLHILVLVMEGRNAIEVANILKLSPETVRRVVRKYNQYGFASLTPKTSPGRPKALTPDQEAQLYDLITAGLNPKIGLRIGPAKLFRRRFGRNLECVWD